jgi:hypothetical protein
MTRSHCSGPEVSQGLSENLISSERELALLQRLEGSVLVKISIHLLAACLHLDFSSGSKIIRVDMHGILYLTFAPEMIETSGYEISEVVLARIGKSCLASSGILHSLGRYNCCRAFSNGGRRLCHLHINGDIKSDVLAHHCRVSQKDLRC